MSASGTTRIALAHPRPTLVARLAALWRFSRPHTLVGTTTSVLALYAIAATTGPAPGPADLAATLIAAACVNVAIVGLNQLEDIEIDRINKPWLPLAAGDLAPQSATLIVIAVSFAAVTLAITQGTIEVVAVGAALAIGGAYSSPPLRLKRYPIVAAMSISVVRAFAVNLGVYGHFAGSLDAVPGVVWAVTAFTLPFGAAIALLKDVPDIDGDLRYQVRTLSVRLGPRRVLAIALALLTAAYLVMAIPVAFALDDVNRELFAAGHLAALILLLVWAARTSPDDPAIFTRFYLRVWGLFFFEYVLIALCVLAAGS